MNRRQFMGSLVGAGLGVLGVAGCGRDHSAPVRPEAAGRGVWDDRVVLYDTYAMALYMDGGLGPKTGIIKVDYIVAGAAVTMKFWHGHGGKDHYFTVTPENLLDMKSLKKTYIRTTDVDGHNHKLFVDFSDPKWRVPGALPVEVP